MVMAEERITETVDPAGNVTERTVERGAPATTVVERRGGGGAIIAIALIIVALIAAYVVFGINRSDSRKDDAIAAAAQDVGAGARQVGAAAEKAAGDAAK